jgi:hypothetical protein
MNKRVVFSFSSPYDYADPAELPEWSERDRKWSTALLSRSFRSVSIVFTRSRGESRERSTRRSFRRHRSSSRSPGGGEPGSSDPSLARSLRASVGAVR